MSELPYCQADRALLKEVFLALLSNAIKFIRSAAGARIEVGGRREERDGVPMAVNFVKDNGIGFDMKFERRIFGLFERLNFTEDFSGTGCGLALAARIAKRHGGSMWGESILGEGATFFLALPDPDVEGTQP